MRRRVLAAVALVVAGCAEPSPPPPVAVDPGPPTAYVAIGASESVGEGADRPIVEAWPQVLYRTALPLGATFVDLGVAGSTVAEAIDEQLPLALALEPTLVTVWLNVNDLVAGVPVDDYGEQLGELVHGLRRGGATRVLVANVPPLDRLPAYLERAGTSLPGPEVVNAAVDAYNAAIADVAEAEGADLVDLHAAGLAARADGTEASLVSGDGFHPSTAGHARVAETFAAALAG